ncbi:hypothetical protein [Rhodococcus pyridinivorans]|uniref:hypothetical protein n=1 Tax=Rhodococcus pyridinivorans TaxID=103816 RepID=UPI003AAE7E3C
MARLVTHVHVHDKNGTSHVFGPNDEVPKWALAQITNPKAWADQPEPEDVGPAYPEGDPSEAWKVPALIAYAHDKDIDLGDAKRKDDILKIILEEHDDGADTDTDQQD